MSASGRVSQKQQGGRYNGLLRYSMIRPAMKLRSYLSFVGLYNVVRKG